MQWFYTLVRSICESWEGGKTRKEMYLLLLPNRTCRSIRPLPETRIIMAFRSGCRRRVKADLAAGWANGPFPGYWPPLIIVPIDWLLRRRARHSATLRCLDRIRQIKDRLNSTYPRRERYSDLRAAYNFGHVFMEKKVLTGPMAHHKSAHPAPPLSDLFPPIDIFSPCTAWDTSPDRGKMGSGLDITWPKPA